MLIRKQPPRMLGLNEPIRHRESHKRPVTRRDFIASGLMTGPAMVAATGLLGMLAARRAGAQVVPLATDVDDLRSGCGIATVGAGKIPFICFDLAGGANLAGSEVLIGGSGGQLDFLSTAGYAKLGLPGDMVPNAPNAASGTNNFIDTSFGLAWHSDGAILRGMLERTSVTTRAGTNGAVISARSENDTGNNPHNPMYGIWRAGADGQLLTLIGSRASDSGGNSMAPLGMIDAAVRPTKVDRASDVTGLVDTGELASLMSQQDAVAVLESMVRLSGGTDATVSSNGKLGKLAIQANGADDAAVKEAVRCGYVKSADLAARFGGPGVLNPDVDTNIVDPTATRGSAIFGRTEYMADAEFRKTAAVMKMVINGFAGAGTVTMGGYDYHGQGRATGEVRNLRAGRCIGACLEYAQRVGVPLMVYVFSDGSLNAANMVDNTADGRGKFMWVSDNQSTASSFFLVYSPSGRPAALSPDPASVAGGGKQIGYFRADGSVETASHPGANAVNLLVETVLLNYMALHGEADLFADANHFPSHGLGGTTLRESLTAFAPIVSGTIS
jgi:hypothetical protein